MFEIDTILFFCKSKREWFFHERNRPEIWTDGTHCRPSERNGTEAVNCAEVHSADWISILYEKQAVVCARVSPVERNVHSMLVGETCKHRSRDAKTVTTKNLRVFSHVKNAYVSNVNVAGQNRFKIDQKNS